MHRRAAPLVALGALALALAPAAGAQSDPSPADASVNTNAPAGANAGASSVHIVTNPAGAEVRLDGHDGPLLGTTPIEAAAIAPGWHTLFFTREGYSPYELRVQIAAGTDSVHIALVRTTSLRVTSPAAGAAVSVDGSPAGATPLDVDGLSPGPHAVEVRGADGRVFRATVRLRAGARATVRAVFRRR